MDDKQILRIAHRDYLRAQKDAQRAFPRQRAVTKAREIVAACRFLRVAEVVQRRSKERMHFYNLTLSSLRLAQEAFHREPTVARFEAYLNYCDDLATFRSEETEA